MLEKTNTSIDDMRVNLSISFEKYGLTSAQVRALIEYEQGHTQPRKSMLTLLGSYLRRCEKREAAG